MPAPEVRGATRVRVLRPQLQAAGLILSWGLLCWACGKEPAPLPHKPAPTYGMARPRPAPTNTATLPPASGPGQIPSNNSDQANSLPKFELPPQQAVHHAEPQTVETARDYSAELTALLSKSAASCLAGFKPVAKGSISIQVSAQVLSSGAVSRAEVQGSGLTPPILSCIQKLATTSRLLGPIAGAPRSVQAQVALQMQGSPAAPQQKAADPNAEEERDENPRDSKLQVVTNDPPEVEQKDAPEPAEPRDQPTVDDTRADQQP